MRDFTAEEMSDLLGAENIPRVNEWLGRGDGIAVYQNNDLSSSEAGHQQFMSFGSEAAQFVVPPERLPDFSGRIHWRYTLEGTYRGAQLAPPIPRDYKSPASVLDQIVGVFKPEEWTKRPHRVISYQMEVRRFAHGPSYVLFTLDVTFGQEEAQVVNDGLVGGTTITVNCWTNDDGMIDRLAPFSWGIEGGLNMTGGDPNLGGAMVSIANLSAGHPSRMSREEER